MPTIKPQLEVICKMQLKILCSYLLRKIGMLPRLSSLDWAVPNLVNMLSSFGTLLSLYHLPQKRSYPNNWSHFLMNPLSCVCY